MNRGVGLLDLVDVLSDASVHGRSDVRVLQLAHDSRTVEPGALFVAVRGIGADGHRFLADAVSKGAVAVVSEELVEFDGVTTIVVPDSTRALALLASRWYGDPSQGLRMVGVTGTNGKTSTAHLLRSICRAASWGVGVIGTIGHGAGSTLEVGVHTTPDPLTLHRLLAEMKAQECIGVVMEVSSHAVRQQRTSGIDFEIGMLTNVTRDHLDYHSSFDDYVDAKREFCESLVGTHRRKPPGVLVYSLDNPHSRAIGGAFSGRKLATSTEAAADVFAEDIEATLAGTRFTLILPDGTRHATSLKLLGSFSVANAVMAAAAATCLGIGADAIVAGLQALERVPGRFDALGGGGKPVVIVDYSHTPDSLERMLEFCRSLRPKRLITVFGCGGDRDRGKRPVMGEIAQKNSDACYVTSDNPRSEDPLAIIEDVLAGMDRDAPGLFVEPDRRTAIRRAVASGEDGDLVAVCGKGHEDYQIIGTTRHHFDDREEAAKALNEWTPPGDR